MCEASVRFGLRNLCTSLRKLGKCGRNGGVRLRDLGAPAGGGKAALFDRALCRRNIRTCLRMRRRGRVFCQRRARHRFFILAFCVREVGLRLFELYFEVGSIQLHEKVALVDKLIAFDKDLLDVSGNFRADLHDVAIDERIVRRFELARIEPINETCYGQDRHHRAADHEDAATFTVRFARSDLFNAVFSFRDLRRGFDLVIAAYFAFFAHQIFVSK